MFTIMEKKCYLIFQDHCNALHLACIGGHLRVVKYLIPKFGDNKFDMDRVGQNCLHKAVKEGHVRLATYLIKECGFDPNLRDVVCVCVCMHVCMCARAYMWV